MNTPTLPSFSSAPLTPPDLGRQLEQQRLRKQLRRGALGEAAGLSYQSLQKILDGQSDFRVSNLLALAHALGLEVVLVPSSLRQALQAPAALPGTDGDGTATPSAVGAALARLRPLAGPGTPPKRGGPR
ncbi:helix-turn-helix domain-containing protein [Xylophilus sp. ASV27]|uniref:helix-turn-helix domain-containing protein n=1 Tax=Xylophilus sp. ASV27 TaxID=2795129 RepID=UPI0018ECEBA8